MPETDPVKYFGAEIKRLNYYNSQFLKEDDFRDEQLYHRQMRHFHNRSLHTWGIVAGLDVRPAAGARKVTVSAGTAIDRLGQEIVLPQETSLPRENALPEEGDIVSFDQFDGGSTLYLTIRYREVFDQADKDTQSTSKLYTRTTERPQLNLSSAAPAPDSAEVVLATITLDTERAVARVGPELRRYAGSRIGSSADGKEFSLYADSAGDWHFFDGSKGADRLSVDDKGNLKIGSGDLQLDSGREIFFKDGGQIRSADDAHRILFRRAENKLELREYGDLVFSPGATAGAETARVVMLGSGNVGVGTPTPQHKLEVSGWFAVGGSTLGQGGRNGDVFRLEAAPGATDLVSLRFDQAALRFWNPVGGDLLKITREGNVGIGAAATAPGVRLAVGGNGGNVYVTDAWVENNMHVQGNETLKQGGRGRLRLGTAWTYIGFYAETSSTAANNDLALGASSGNVRLGDGSSTQNLLIPKGDIRAGRAMLHFGTTDGSRAAANEVVGGLGFLGYGQSHGQLSYRVGPPGWFEFLDRSGDGPSLSFGTVGFAGVKAGQIRAENSDIYFTKTDHNHTGIGNTLGYAAIENATDYGVLMILGRSTADGRQIGMWDDVSVARNLKVGGLFVPNAAINLRILGGTINSGGGILSAGTGFSVRKVGEGRYQIFFSQPFTGIPFASATQIYPNPDDFGTGGNTRDNVVIVGLNQSNMMVKTGNGDGNPVDRYFTFVVIGSR